MGKDPGYNFKMVRNGRKTFGKKYQEDVVWGENDIRVNFREKHSFFVTYARPTPHPPLRENVLSICCYWAVFSCFQARVQYCCDCSPLVPSNVDASICRPVPPFPMPNYSPLPVVTCLVLCTRTSWSATTRSCVHPTSTVPSSRWVFPSEGIRIGGYSSFDLPPPPSITILPLDRFPPVSPVSHRLCETSSVFVSQC